MVRFGPGCSEPGLDGFNVDEVHEVIRAVEARPGDEATVTEMDLKRDDWQVLS